MNKVRYWSYMSTTITDGNYTKKLASPSKKSDKIEKEKKKKNKKGSCKAFCVTCKRKKLINLRKITWYVIQCLQFIFQWTVKCTVAFGKSDWFSETNQSNSRKAFCKMFIGNTVPCSYREVFTQTRPNSKNFSPELVNRKIKQITK